MTTFRCAAILGLFLAGVSTASAADDPQAGKAVAERWCAGCHLVSEAQTRANPDVPSFAAIAARYAEAGAFGPLRAFLADPHPPMPDMSLTRQEIRDLAAYIETQRP